MTDDADTIEHTKTKEMDDIKSSMDVASLNNLIVSMRPLFKKAKVHILHKLTRTLKIHQTKLKTGKEQSSKLGTKIHVIQEEIKAFKGLKADELSKFVLSNELSFNQIAEKGDIKEKVMARVAMHPDMKSYVEKWRKEHEDWKSLAAFMKSKNTGRRFKKKKSKNKSQIKANNKDLEKVTLNESLSGVVSTSARKKQSKQMLDNDNVSLETTENLQNKSDSLTNNSIEEADASFPHSQHDSNSLTSDTKTMKPNSLKRHKTNALSLQLEKYCQDVSRNNCSEKVNLEVNTKNEGSMFIKKLNLEELQGDFDSSKYSESRTVSVLSNSTEEKLPKRSKSNFFLGGGNSETDSASDQKPDAAALTHEYIQDIDDDEEGTGKMMLRKTFIATLTGKNLQKQGQKKDTNVHKHAKHSISNQSQSAKDWNSNKQFSHKAKPYVGKNGPSKNIAQKDQQEKLHPSWEASKRRKLEQSQLTAFTGKKIIFKDD